MSSVTGQAIRRGPAHSKSWPEKAATTPSMARALDTSTFSILACARGLRTTAIQSMSAATRSSVYFPRPVISSASSLRGTACPTYRSEVSAMSLTPQADAGAFRSSSAAASTAFTMFW